MTQILSVTGAFKKYGAVTALRGADLSVNAGEVHAICGDNGAGKSTLIKLIAGVEAPDKGTIEVRGTPVTFGDPQDALAAGIATIHQDLGLAPAMAIYQNIYLGSELSVRFAGIPILKKRAMMRGAREILAKMNSIMTDMTKPVEALSGGQRQAVAIARALRWNADIIIMDEPTAALGVRETKEVVRLIEELRNRGATVLLISHNMADVVAVADRATILKGGRAVTSLSLEGVSADALAKMIMEGADGADDTEDA